MHVVFHSYFVSDVGIYDRVVVQEIIKELAQTQQIDKSKRPFKGNFHSELLYASSNFCFRPPSCCH